MGVLFLCSFDLLKVGSGLGERITEREREARSSEVREREQQQ